jgi:anti-sigma factor RsiW
MEKACRNYSETLVLDVLGELNDSRMCSEWERHLKACGACRIERARTLQLLGRVREAGMPPELSAAQMDAMAGAVGWRLRNERRARPQETGWRLRLVPALAAACALLVVVAFGYRFKDRWAGPEGGGEITAELPAEDLDIIKHLDLLKDMDTIEKLIHVVDIDLPPNGQAPDPPAPETQGMHRDENGKA